MGAEGLVCQTELLSSESDKGSSDQEVSDARATGEILSSNFESGTPPEVSVECVDLAPASYVGLAPDFDEWEPVPCCHGYFPELEISHPVPKPMGINYRRPTLPGASEGNPEIRRAMKVRGLRPELPEGLLEGAASKYGLEPRHLTSRAKHHRVRCGQALLECYKALRALGWTYAQIGFRFSSKAENVLDVLKRAEGKSKNA